MRDFDVNDAAGAAIAALYDRWPVLATFTTQRLTRYDTVLAQILCLNDIEGWTRERIADWVETIEAATVVPEAACVTELVAAGSA